MKNFYLILSCCIASLFTVQAQEFSGDNFNGTWESDGGSQKEQPTGWHSLYSNVSGLISMKAGTVSKGGDTTDAYPIIENTFAGSIVFGTKYGYVIPGILSLGTP